jgi:hypothetical protein
MTADPLDPRAHVGCLGAVALAALRVLSWVACGVAIFGVAHVAYGSLGAGPGLATTVVAALGLSALHVRGTLHWIRRRWTTDTRSLVGMLTLVPIGSNWVALVDAGGLLAVGALAASQMVRGD